MQTDVKATKPLTATGAFKTPGNDDVKRCRVKGIYAVPGASAGSVAIADGNGGDTLLTVNTTAGGAAVYLTLPGQGILFATGPYGTVTNTSSMVLFYG